MQPGAVISRLPVVSIGEARDMTGSRLLTGEHGAGPIWWERTDVKRTAVSHLVERRQGQCAALYELRGDPCYEVVGLMTSVSEEFRRVSHHGVREELLEAQAEAIGLPLTKIYLPSGKTAPCTNEVYEQIMGRAMEVSSRGAFTPSASATCSWRICGPVRKKHGRGGDERRLSHMERDTRQLSRKLIAMGFKAILSCVEAKVGSGVCRQDVRRALCSTTCRRGSTRAESTASFTRCYDGPCFKGPWPCRSAKPWSGTVDITRICCLWVGGAGASSRRS